MNELYKGEETRIYTPLYYERLGHYEMIPWRKELYDDLYVLAKKEIKTEAEKLEEQKKANQWWELENVEWKLKNGYAPWMEKGLSDIQKRIMFTCCWNTGI